MRILFISADLPTRRDLRPYGMISALASRGHQVTVVCAAPPGSQQHEADLRARGAAVVAVRQGPAERRQNMLRALLGPMPLQAAAAASPQLLEAVGAAARSGAYDVAHVDGIAASALGHALAGLPAVLDAGGCASRALAQRARAGWRHGALAAIELGRTRRYEAAYLDRYKRVFAASADDAWALRLLGGPAHAPQTIHVVPTPIIIDHAVGPPTLREQGDLLVCAEADGYAAAVEELLSAAMPIIWGQRAEIRLLLAGPPPARLAQHSAADPRILSVSADDLRASARATIALAPGGGTTAANHALQAMARGAPLVASPQIGRALRAVAGRDLLVADGPVELARAVLDLLDDPRYRGQIGRAGRDYAERTHSPEVVTNELAQIYAAACGAAIAGWRLDVGLSSLLSPTLGA
ncbi:MAG: glycosyltransferase family 4 protein [Chloroflexales bacterium]